MPDADARMQCYQQIIRAWRDDLVARDTEHVGFAGNSSAADFEFRKRRAGWVMSGAEQKAELRNKTSLGDLERVVKARKYEHCRAEYTKLAMEPNTMPQVRDRYLRIAQYYRELEETEPASA
jgi:hypothetical protein